MRYSELEAGGAGARTTRTSSTTRGTSEYLVSLTADGLFGPREDEVYVQRISAGAQIGAGPPSRRSARAGDTPPRAVRRAAVAADPVNKRNLVVWASDDKPTDGVRGLRPAARATGQRDRHQRLRDLRGATPVRCTRTSRSTRARAAQGDEEYLVVWTGQGKLAPVQWGRRFDENGAPIGARFQISQFAESGSGSLPASPTTPSTTSTSSCGTRSSRARTPRPGGSACRPPARRSAATSGSRRPAPTPTTRGPSPAIAYNPLAGNYLLTWTRNEPRRPRC